MMLQGRKYAVHMVYKIHTNLENPIDTTSLGRRATLYVRLLFENGTSRSAVERGL